MPKKADYDQVHVLAIATPPLLELFAVCDDVFTEDDAFSPAKIKTSLGRIYRQYKKSRGQLDPDFKNRNGNARRFVAEQKSDKKRTGTSGKRTSQLHGDEHAVLRPAHRRKNRKGQS